jgi:hypothetical protein
MQCHHSGCPMSLCWDRDSVRSPTTANVSDQRKRTPQLAPKAHLPGWQIPGAPARAARSSDPLQKGKRSRIGAPRGSGDFRNSDYGPPPPVSSVSGMVLFSTPRWAWSMDMTVLSPRNKRCQVTSGQRTSATLQERGAPSMRSAAAFPGDVTYMTHHAPSRSDLQERFCRGFMNLHP